MRAFIRPINKYMQWYSVKIAVETVEMNKWKIKLSHQKSRFTWNKLSNVITHTNDFVILWWIMGHFQLNTHKYSNIIIFITVPVKIKTHRDFFSHRLAYFLRIYIRPFRWARVSVKKMYTNVYKAHKPNLGVNKKTKCLHISIEINHVNW